MFKKLESGNGAGFFEHVAPDVDWTVMGTHPLAGRYTSLDDFQKKTIKRLGDTVKEPGLNVLVRNVIGGGEGAWATGELAIVGECKNGSCDASPASESWCGLG